MFLYLAFTLSTAWSNPAPLSPTEPNPQGTHEAQEWLRTHAHEVASIDAATQDRRDLEPLRELVGDARLVLIGEASHSAGNDMLARARMIDWLRDELGFAVLVMESGLGDVRTVQESLDAGYSIEEAAPQGIFGLWSETHEGLAGLRAAEGMQLYGYDAQASAPRGSAENWRPLLEDALAAAEGLDAEAGMDDARRSRLESAIDTLSAGAQAKVLALRTHMGMEVARPEHLQGRDLPTEFAQLADDLEALVALLGEPAGDESGLAIRATASLAAYSRNLSLETDPKFWSSPEGFAESFTRRDRAGADNVLWLARERFPEERIIVWAHDAHISKAHISAAAITGGAPEQSTELRAGFGTPLGYHLAQELAEEMVVIGFLGSSGPLPRHPGAPGPASAGEFPIPGSLEQLCSDGTNADFLLVNLRGAELPFTLCGPIDHVPVHLDDWSRAYDAFFWSRQVVPTTRRTAGPVSK